MNFKSAIVIMNIFICAGSEASYLSERGCANKKANLARELEYAHVYGNSHRIRGIERALSKINEYCTPAAMRERYNILIKEKEKEILKLESEIYEHKDYSEADKLYKKNRKLKDAQSELLELKKFVNN